MSVKSDRRVWFAANVEPRPMVKAHEAEYLAWVARANAYMVSRCVPGTAILKDPADVPAVAPKSVARASKRSATDIADREQFQSHLEHMQAEIADAMGWPGMFWDDFWKPQRHGMGARRRPRLEFCKGSLHVAWPHLTEEMQRLHESGVWAWTTFADFKAAKVAERVEMRDAYMTEGDCDSLCESFCQVHAF
ncbi:hypothetical protein ACSHWG_00835 [Leucobacter sp. Z1108]|uniref:hypothetical protein n=1 Tax=Leucobacter sp. Z1108 TaxID=3439066 RepID=UPI003F3BEE8C